MSPTPEPDARTRSHTAARRLNGGVWGLMLLLALTFGIFRADRLPTAIVPLLLLLVVAGAGACVNLVLMGWKLLTGRFRQAQGYGLGLVLLALTFCWLRYYLSDFPVLTKIGG
jgi:hypothetical protein